jgi:PKD repeat protein
VISPGNTLIRNITHDNEDSGINIYPGGNNTLVTLNVTYNNGDHGIDDLNVTGGRLIGNTVYRNCTSGINVEGTSGSYTVENNVAVDNAVYPAYNGISCSRRSGNIGIFDSAPSSTTVDHNLVFLTKPGTMYTFGSGYSSLAAMQAATGQEDHGVQADPRFASASAADLRLSAGSPAIDRGDSGVSGEQSSDLLGNPRVDDPTIANTQAEGPRLYDDLGAYEFQPSGSTPPPPGNTAPTARLTVTPTSGNAPLQVSADASASTDAEGQTLSYAFSFGDGTTAGPQPAATASHTFAAAGSYQVTVTVTDTGGLTSSATRTVTVGSGSTPTPAAYVSQIATNYSTSTKTTGTITVWRSAGVRAGDLVALTLYLGSPVSGGTVTGTDTAGNSYATVSSVADASGNRLVVLAGVATTALAANDKITATFPTATGYRLIGDEFSGVSSVGTTASSTGPAGTFGSGAVAASAGQLVLGAVLVAPGTGAPTWAAGWRNLGTYAVGSSYVSRAYQLPTSSTSIAATGTASGPWAATAATFLP